MPFTAPYLLDGLAFTNVPSGTLSADATVTAEVPTDGIYHRLTLKLKHGASPAFATEAEFKTVVKEIRLKIDGKVQQVYSATQLIAYLKFHGYTIEDGFLEIPLGRPWLQTTGEQDITMWGTADVQTIHIEVDLASGTINPALSLKWQKSMFNTPMGNIIKFRRQTLGVTSTGLRNETNLPKNDKYVQMHLFMGGAADINSVEIALDNRTVYEMSAADTTAHLKYWGFVEQANIFHIPFDYRGRSLEFLEPWILNDKGQRVRPHASFEFDMDMAAANDVTMMQVLIGPRD